MKRFYTLVSVGDDLSIRLDGKPVKTPGGRVLTASARALANAVAAEWAAQVDIIVPDAMPLTQILTTILDHGTGERPALTGKVLAYIDTDLLCYRIDAPDGLVALQTRRRDVWLDWFSGTYGTALCTTTGLAALTQPIDAHKAVAGALADMDDARFTVCQIVTALTGSIVLALAFMAGAATPGQLFEAVNMEEDFKADIYNEAEHGSAPLQEKKQQAMRRDLEAARIFLDLLPS